MNLWKYVVADSSGVRLANGSNLNCVGYINLIVKFTEFKWQSKFYILDCEVPLILGMPFCKELQPVFDWKDSRIFVQSGDRYVALQTTLIENYSDNSQQHAKRVDNSSNVVDLAKSSN